MIRAVRATFLSQLTKGHLRGMVMARNNRMLSSAPPKFDEEMAHIYSHIANQHFHENGPWPVMLDTVKKHLAVNPNAKVLDIATGPGQPGISIAKNFPKAEIFLLDVSEDMLAMAKENAKDVPNSTTVLANAGRSSL